MRACCIHGKRADEAASNLAAAEALNARLVEALREFAVHTYNHNPVVKMVRCRLCDSAWPPGSNEQHAPDCLLAKSEDSQNAR
jgi:hypothetical protein